MNRIKELRIKKDVTVNDLAEFLGISQGTLSNYENGVRKPRKQEIWDKLAEYFEVNVPYLMGLENDSLGHLPWFKESAFSFSLMKLRKNHLLSHEEFAEKIKMSTDVVKKLERGEYIHSPEIIKVIADTFGVEESFLEDPNNIPTLTTAERKIIDSYKTENVVLENVQTILLVNDTHEATSFNEETGEIKTIVVTGEMQAKDRLLKSMNLEKKSLEELIEVFKFMMNYERNKIGKEITPQFGEGEPSL